MTYHDACHLAHGQQIREAPRALLSRLPNVQLGPPARKRSLLRLGGHLQLHRAGDGTKIAGT